jgi:hypothetical protein
MGETELCGESSNNQLLNVRNTDNCLLNVPSFRLCVRFLLPDRLRRFGASTDGGLVALFFGAISTRAIEVPVASSSSVASGSIGSGYRNTVGFPTSYGITLQ